MDLDIVKVHVYINLPSPKVHKLMKHEGYVQPCPYCEKYYSDKAGCRGHIKKKHQGMPVNLPELVQLSEGNRERKQYTHNADITTSKVLYCIVF